MMNKRTLYISLLCIVGVIFACLLTYIVYKIWGYIRKNAETTKVDTFPCGKFFPHNVPVPVSYTRVRAQDPLEDVHGENEQDLAEKGKLRSNNILKDAKKAKPFTPPLPRKNIGRKIDTRRDKIPSRPRGRTIIPYDESHFHASKMKSNKDMRHPFPMQGTRREINIRGNSLTEEMFINSINDFNSSGYNTDTPSDSSLSTSRESILEDFQQQQGGVMKEGKIRFTTKYIKKDLLLQVRIMTASDLAPDRDINDIKPFIRVSLHPGKQKQDTKFEKEHKKNPLFNEIINFPGLSVFDIGCHRLRLHVYNRVRVKRKELLGMAELDLNTIDLENEKEYTLPLHEAKKKVDEAYMNISLNHQFTISKLSVTLHDVQLPRRYKLHANPYVTLEFFRNDCLIDTKQTTIRRKTTNPLYNEHFHFPITLKDSYELQHYSVRLTLKHNNMITGRCKEIGHVILSLTSSLQSSREQWKKTIEVADDWSKICHSLMMSDDL